MKNKKNYKINSIASAQIQKEADQVILIQKQIEALKVKLFTIKDENNWLQNISSDSTEGLTLEEQVKVSKAINIFRCI